MLLRVRILSGLIMLLCLRSSHLAAQPQITFDYPMTIPYGETADFISDTSYQGLGFTTFFPSQSNVYLGLSFQWMGWDENRDRATYQENGATISGSEDKEINAYPLLLQGRYEISRGILRPYVGLGVGVAYIEQSRRLGFLSDSEYDNQGILSPELGFYLNLSNLVLGLGAQYYDSFTGSDAVELESLAIRMAVGVAAF